MLSQTTRAMGVGFIELAINPSALKGISVALTSFPRTCVQNFGPGTDI
jgi:hypothetical protein